MAEIKITLETLYDILRNEKKREDLQKLDATFFLDVVSYLQEKKALLESKKYADEVFAAGERDKLEYELRSIKRILKEIFEKREKKIIDIALNRSRTGSDIIDTSSMLFEEKDFYKSVLAVLDGHRRNVLWKLSNGELPGLKQNPPETESPAVVSPMPSSKTKIKFTHPLPRFVWKDRKEYGPFEAGDETEIYTEVAELIVRKGRAEKVPVQ